MAGHKQGTANIQEKNSQGALIIVFSFYLINRKRSRNILIGYYTVGTIIIQNTKLYLSQGYMLYNPVYNIQQLYNPAVS